MSETPPFADAPTNGAPTIAASRTSARRRILPVIVGVGLVLLIGFIIASALSSGGVASRERKTGSDR